MTWKGKKMNVGRKYSFRYSRIPFFAMPYMGTAMNTMTARADVVVSDDVGATYPGMKVKTLENRMKRNSVAMKGK